MPNHAEIVSLIGKRAFAPVMSNLTRPLYVEAMVALLLGKRWRYLGDWDGWDLERDDGKRLEVKQSAARQPRTDRPGLDGRGTAPRFDIAPRDGYWLDGANEFVAEPGRHAHIFVFAHHPVLDAKECDQRDPAQWRFYVLPTTNLPEGQQSIGLRPLIELGAREVLHGRLADEVQRNL
jgi:hypothetical protein